MKSRNLFAIAAGALLLATASAVTAATPRDFTAKATVDSATMIMGSKTAMHIEVVGPIADRATFFFNNPSAPEGQIVPVDKIQTDNYEVVPEGSVTITDLGNGRRQMRQNFLVQVFDSGLYKLPPMICVSGTDTIKTNSPVLKVDPVSLDTANLVMKGEELVDLRVHDFTDIHDLEKKFFDFMPDWLSRYWMWILVGLLVFASGIFVYWKWLRHGRIPFVPAKKPTPPYDLAMQRLNELQEKQLWQQGADKEYYSQLTEILRVYLQGRFGINAMEMTTYQISEALAANPETSELRRKIDSVLADADFVKFAKARPEAHINERAFATVRDFVEETKPQPEAENPEQKPEETQAEKHSAENPKIKPVNPASNESTTPPTNDQ